MFCWLMISFAGFDGEIVCCERFSGWVSVCLRIRRVSDSGPSSSRIPSDEISNTRGEQSDLLLIVFAVITMRSVIS